MEKQAPIEFKRFMSNKLRPNFLIKFILFFALFLLCLSLIYHQIHPELNEQQSFPKEIHGVKVEVTGK